MHGWISVSHSFHGRSARSGLEILSSFVRTCANSSLSADIVICLSMVLLYHFSGTPFPINFTRCARCLRRFVQRSRRLRYFARAQSMSPVLRSARSMFPTFRSAQSTPPVLRSAQSMSPVLRSARSMFRNLARRSRRLRCFTRHSRNLVRKGRYSQRGEQDAQAQQKYTRTQSVFLSHFHSPFLSAYFRPSVENFQKRTADNSERILAYFFKYTQVRIRICVKILE